jgi:hypothetical protein
MEIENVVLCEFCFAGKENTAAKKGIFSTLSKEPIAKVFAWAKIKRTQSSYLLREHQLFLENPLHYHARPMLVSLCSTNVGTGILLYASVSVCALPHQLFLHLVVCRRGAKSTGLSGAKLDDVERFWAGIRFRVQPYGCCTITAGSAEN